MTQADPVPSVLRRNYPFRARILTSNPYGLPLGKEFLCARRKEADASPYPVEVFSWGRHGSYALYQFTETECQLLPAEVPGDTET